MDTLLQTEINKIKARIEASEKSVAELSRLAVLGYQTVRGLAKGTAAGLTIKTKSKIEKVLDELGV